MKKSNLLMLLAAPIVLMGCGENNSNIVPTGESVAKEDIAVHYAKATEAMDNVEAFGIKLTGEAKLDSNVNFTSQVGDSKQTISTNSSIEVKDLSVEAGIKNIKSTDIKEISASVEASAAYAIKMTAEGVPTDTNANMDLSGNVSANVYVQDGFSYLDFEGLRNIITSIKPGTTLPENLKIKSQLSELEEGETAIEVDWSEMISSIETDYSSSLNCIKGKNNVYSYVFSIDPSKVLENTNTDFSNMDFSSEGNSTLYVSFNDNGLTSIGLLIDWSASSNVEDSEYGYSNSSTASLHMDLKMDFLYGNDVKVKEVPNKDSFVEQTLA